jgi:hypothetical protein
MLIATNPITSDNNINAPANLVLLLTSAAPTMPTIEAIYSDTNQNVLNKQRRKLEYGAP